jgi:hypothetical protein
VGEPPDRIEYRRKRCLSTAVAGRDEEVEQPGVLGLGQRLVGEAAQPLGLGGALSEAVDECRADG